MESIEQSRSQRAIIRGQMIDRANHPMYNPINGANRREIGSQIVPSLNLLDKYIDNGNGYNRSGQHNI